MGVEYSNLGQSGVSKDGPGEKEEYELITGTQPAIVNPQPIINTDLVAGVDEKLGTIEEGVPREEEDLEKLNIGHSP